MLGKPLKKLQLVKRVSDGAVLGPSGWKVPNAAPPPASPAAAVAANAPVSSIGSSPQEKEESAFRKKKAGSQLSLNSLLGG